MVNANEILGKILDSNATLNNQNLEDLIQICENNPDFELPFVLLNKYQPDIFRGFLWQRSEEIISKNKEAFQIYFGKTTEKPAIENKIFDSETERIDTKHPLIEEFLINPEPKYQNWITTLKNFRFSDRTTSVNITKKVSKKPKPEDFGTGFLFDF